MTIVKADIEGWWDMDEGSGSSVADSKESGGTNGTITGANWVTGGPTNLPDGLNFDTATEKVVVAKDFDLPDGTLVVWVESDASTGTVQSIAGNGNGGGNFDLAIVDTTTDYRGRTRFTGDTTVLSNTLTYGVKNHVAYTWTDDGTPEVNLTVDGSAETPVTGTGTTTTNDDNFVWGQRTNETDTLCLDGKIYQVILFNRVLTNTEINDLYNTGAGITYDGLFNPVSETNSNFLMFMI